MNHTAAPDSPSASSFLTEEQQRQIETYIKLLLKWRTRLNLTGIRDEAAACEELVLRSLRILAAADRIEGARLIDVGTGAGIPGLALKIAAPALNVTLLDATGKKIEFVRLAIRELGLREAIAVQGRAEELGHQLNFRETYDFAVARSVGSLAELAELMLPFVKVDGWAIALKSLDVGDEAKEARYAATELGGSEYELREVASPGSAPPDALAISRKLHPTPRRFPRRVGIPHKRPLRASRAGH